MLTEEYLGSLHQQFSRLCVCVFSDGPILWCKVDDDDDDDDSLMLLLMMMLGIQFHNFAGTCEWVLLDVIDSLCPPDPRITVGCLHQRHHFEFRGSVGLSSLQGSSIFSNKNSIIRTVNMLPAGLRFQP